MTEAPSAVEPRAIIVQLTDLHVHVGAGDAVASERIERAIGLVSAMDPFPSAFVLTGDLVNTGTEAEYARLAELLAPLLALGKPVLPIVGNHDDRALLRATLGGAPNVVELGDERHLQYVFELRDDLRILALDTQHTGLDTGKLCARRLAWLEAALADAPDTPTIVAMHHPPMGIGVPALDALGIRPGDVTRFEAIVAEAPQVELVIAGHVHRTVTGRIAHAPVFTCPSVFHASRVAFRADAPLQLVQSPVGVGVHALLAPDGIASHARVVGPTPGEVIPIAPIA